MTRNFALLTVLVLAMSFSAFGQIIDPNVGFCPPTATAAACSTATGLGGHTIAVGTTSFGMWSLGAQDSNAPWYLLLSVPEATAGSASAPTITSASFTQQGTTQDAGAFGRLTSGDIYAFASAKDGGLNGDSSMNAPNMFCDGLGNAFNVCGTSNEISAFGSEPNFFEIFVYTFEASSTVGFLGGTAYSFSSSPGMVGGTYLAALAIGGTRNNIQFSTPFTDAGLVSSSSSGGPGGGPASGPIPEPNSIVLLGSALLAASAALRRKFVRS